MEAITNKIVRHTKSVNYTKHGVLVSNTTETKTIILKGEEKQVKTRKSNTCFNIKNVGCSGLSKEFLKGN